MKVTTDQYARSNSRNINAYVRAHVEVRALDLALAAAKRRRAVAEGRLTGGQKGEAERLLREVPA
jgi:hypothetical protein